MKKEELIKRVKTQNKKHVIFDFDETICTLRIDWNVWIKEMLEMFQACEKDFAFDESRYAETQNDFMLKYGEEIKNKIIDINYDVEKNHYSGYEVIERSVSLLPEISKLAELSVWTSNDRRTITPILDELGIDKYFGKIICRNDVDFIKPDPAGFYLIYDNKNPKSEYLYIGNSRVDSEAAKNSGIDFVNINDITD
jgi:HAD superfamily hydrolase (TIGR01549 family)